MGYKILEAQPTPNPNAIKLVLDKPIVEQTLSFLHREEAAGHPLATELFAVPGVTSLLFLGDFLTVNKTPDATWAAIRKAVGAILKKS